MTILPGVSQGSEVRVTRVDGRTFSGRLKSWGVESVVLDRGHRSRVRGGSDVIRVSLEAVAKIEPWDRWKGFIDG